MVIQTTAPDRKTLAKALSDHLGEEAVYNGPPTFAYTIGQATVNREGEIVLLDDMNASELKAFLVHNGWLEPELDRMTISVPVDGLTVRTMHNLILMLYSKQYLLGKAIKAKTIRIDDAVISRLNETLPECVADYITLVDAFKAKGQITGVDFTIDSVSFSFPLSDKQDVIHAFTLLTIKIIDAAKAAALVLPECQQPENEKYYMRSWLVRIGFGGKEAKGMRDVLLKHLKGNSAFQSDLEAQRYKEKYAQIRKIKRDTQPDEVQYEQI